MIERFIGRRRSRCIVIALDGVGSTDFRAWADAVTPTLAAVAHGGASARLASPLPPLSAVAWASFATATNPGRHGVFGFTLPDGEYRMTFASSHSVRVPTLWDRAAIDGMRSIIVNLPGTYPAQPMSGTLVAGFVAPSLERACHPPSLAPRLASAGYRLDVDVRLAVRDETAFLTNLDGSAAARIDAMRWMLAEERWSLAVLAFTEPDRLLHARYPSPDDDTAPGSAYRRLLARIDSFTAELADRYPEATIMVASDHGFAPLKRYFNVNAWLRERGHLEAEQLEAIDHRTIAFALDPGRIYVNAQSRFARGAIPAESARSTSELLAAELLAIRTPDGSQPIASVVHRRDAYSGPLTELGPNLVCVPARGWELKASMRLPLISTPDALRGTHSADDALFVSSRASPRPIGDASLHDVGATVLAALGVQADDVDGRSLL